MAATSRARVLTGVRPTGALHLGHYAGALTRWVRLQDEHECFFLIADYQVSDYVHDIAHVRTSVREVALDWLAVGLDPERSHFAVESMVPQNAELTMLLSWFVPLSRLERNPTLKAEMEQLDEAARGVPVGFFIYPLMQVANILLPRAGLVPVGEDQLPHVEMTREIARRVNREFGPVFVEPEALVGTVRRLVGVDGRAKMGKSLGNAIYLKDDADTVRAKVMSMFTDPTRLRATDPGHVEGNAVFAYHDAFNPDPGEVEELKERRRIARALDRRQHRHRIVDVAAAVLHVDGHAVPALCGIDLARKGIGNRRPAADAAHAVGDLLLQSVGFHSFLSQGVSEFRLAWPAPRAAWPR